MTRIPVISLSIMWQKSKFIDTASLIYSYIQWFAYSFIHLFVRLSISFVYFLFIFMGWSRGDLHASQARMSSEAPLEKLMKYAELNQYLNVNEGFELQFYRYG